MEIMHWRDCRETPVEKISYREKIYDVIGTSIRWLSKNGDDGRGNPSYGLRLFTIQPGGEIPAHNHAYDQTMYILEGEFECWEFDPDTDKIVQRESCGPGSSVYIPGMQPHGMKNTGDKPGTFLCCICNVCDEGTLA